MVCHGCETHRSQVGPHALWAVHRRHVRAFVPRKLLATGIGTERLAPKMSFGDSGRVVRGMPHGVTTPILHVDRDRTRHTDWQGFCSALSVRKRGSLKCHPPRFARKAMCDFGPEWCFCRWHRAARCHLGCAKVRIVCERAWTLVRQCLWARPRR